MGHPVLWNQFRQLDIDLTTHVLLRSRDFHYDVVVYILGLLNQRLRATSPSLTAAIIGGHVTGAHYYVSLEVGEVQPKIEGERRRHLNT